MKSWIFRKITVYIRRLLYALLTVFSTSHNSGPIKTFVVQGTLACSITRNGNSEPSVRILRATCLHCQECKCVFYLLIDAEDEKKQVKGAVCPHCGSGSLTTFELL